jgi:hypothetical protein
MRNTLFVLLSITFLGCAAHNATGPIADGDAGPDGSPGDNVTLLQGDTNGDGVVNAEDDADAGAEQDGALADSDASTVLGDGAVAMAMADGGQDAGAVMEPDAGAGAGSDASMVMLNACGGVGGFICGGVGCSTLPGKSCISLALPVELRCGAGGTYDDTKSKVWTCSGPNELVCPACVK